MEQINVVELPQNVSIKSYRQKCKKQKQAKYLKSIKGLLDSGFKWNGGNQHGDYFIKKPF